MNIYIYWVVEKVWSLLKSKLRQYCFLCFKITLLNHTLVWFYGAILFDELLPFFWQRHNPVEL